ncbi:MAG: siphovirus Gp157 family protein [Bacteroidales bacterium]|nr:siphovirus Gp157 family protein [Bacteroidales bacterium]
MASLYEIDKAILDCVDMETGEIVDVEKLEALQLARETKLESVALWIKNLTADALAYKAEKEAFAEREKKAKDKVDSLKKYLADALNGEKMTTSKVAVSFRKSVSVEVDEESCPYEWMIEKVTRSADKTAIKSALKDGATIPGCVLVEKQNIQIK